MNYRTKSLRNLAIHLAMSVNRQALGRCHGRDCSCQVAGNTHESISEGVERGKQAEERRAKRAEKKARNDEKARPKNPAITR